MGWAWGFGCGASGLRGFRNFFLAFGLLGSGLSKLATPSKLWGFGVREFQGLMGSGIERFFGLGVEGLQA